MSDGKLGMGSPHFHGGEQVLPQWEEVGRARFGQPWEGGLEGSVGHTGTPRKGKGGRGTHLWGHLGAAGQEGITGVIPIPHCPIIFINAGSGVEKATTP